MWTMTRFYVVLRGYDRDAVDALVDAVDAAAGDPDRIEAAVTARGELRIVNRGYDRRQVDAWLEHHRAAELATGAAASSPTISGPELVIVMRGYRIAETDALLAIVGPALAGNDRVRRAEALRAVTETRLPASFRGYDRRRIDSYLERAVQNLRAQ
jgi:hypothetical protein